MADIFIKNFPNIKLRKYLNDFELVKTLTINSLKIKYKRSKLGLSWSLLNPIFNITVISFVFSTIMGMTYSKFAVFFFSGFIAWSLFANCLVGATHCLINNESLIKKVPINILVFPLVTIGVNVVEFTLALLTMTVLLFLLGLKLSVAFFFLPISFILLLLFTAGLVLIISVITTFFRDFSHIFLVVIQLWFYLTPVLYPKTVLSGNRQILKLINPMVIYIDLFRDPIANNQLPFSDEILIACLLSMIVFSLGIFMFNKYKSKIIFNL